MSSKYWCQECNREKYSQEELINTGGSFRNGEPYYPEGHRIDVFGPEQLVEEFAATLSAMSLKYAMIR